MRLSAIVSQAYRRSALSIGVGMLVKAWQVLYSET